MNTLEIYAREARKHGMTYGQYEAAIRNGELPPPKTSKKQKEHTPSLKADDSIPTYRKCKRCEKMFALPNPESQKRFCLDCANIGMQEAGARRRKTTDYANCELCGAEFYRGKYPHRNQAKQGKMCPECHDKWLHMNTDQKREFKSGERTLERLEIIRHGGKFDGSDTYYLTCFDCGQLFPAKSKARTAMYCSECKSARMKRPADRLRDNEYYNCEICGMGFRRGRYPNGHVKGRKYCTDCLAKWRSLGVEEKRIFAAGAKTIERLEDILNGNKTDR